MKSNKCTKNAIADPPRLYMDQYEREITLILGVDVLAQVTTSEHYHFPRYRNENLMSVFTMFGWCWMGEITQSIEEQTYIC